jgi:hypothetical protein
MNNWDYCHTTLNFNVDAPLGEKTPVTMAFAQYSCLPCSTTNCAPQNFAIKRS